MLISKRQRIGKKFIILLQENRMSMNNVELDKTIKREHKEIKSEMAQISVLLDKILAHLQKDKGDAKV